MCAFCVQETLIEFGKNNFITDEIFMLFHSFKVVKYNLVGTFSSPLTDFHEIHFTALLLYRYYHVHISFAFIDFKVYIT
jgi:hypothetical protein